MPYLTNPEEQQLVERLATGEINVFWQLFQQHRDYLLRCCCKWMNNNLAAAEDLLSQSMIKSWEKVKEKVLVIKDFKAWISKVTYNLSIDTHRQCKRGAIGVEDLEVMVLGSGGVLVSKEETPVLAA